VPEEDRSRRVVVEHFARPVAWQRIEAGGGRVAGGRSGIYNVDTLLGRQGKMRVEIQKWGNSAAVRVPAPALKDAGIQIGQSLELRAESGRLILEPASESLDDLLARITPENRHDLALEGKPVGGEAW